MEGVKDTPFACVPSLATETRSVVPGDKDDNCSIAEALIGASVVRLSRAMIKM
jgi:hypothetical protein